MADGINSAFKRLNSTLNEGLEQVGKKVILGKYNVIYVWDSSFFPTLPQS
jgi:hypothetical protein